MMGVGGMRRLGGLWGYDRLLGDIFMSIEAACHDLPVSRPVTPEPEKKEGGARVRVAGWRVARGRVLVGREMASGAVVRVLLTARGVCAGQFMTGMVLCCTEGPECLVFAGTAPRLGR